MRNTSLNSNSLFKEIIEMCSVTLSFDAMTLHILLAVTSTNFICNLRKANPMGFKNGFPKIFFRIFSDFYQKIVLQSIPQCERLVDCFVCISIQKSFYRIQIFYIENIENLSNKTCFYFTFAVEQKQTKFNFIWIFSSKQLFHEITWCIFTALNSFIWRLAIRVCC